MLEYNFQCPYCWQDISVLLDASIPEQQYVEDCEVCCNPIHIKVEFDHGSLKTFQASKLGQ